jgi:hypothetical protein
VSKKKIFGFGVVIHVIALGVWLKGCIPEDKCLDAGGVWNDEAKTCER